jgi:hypothetical protein
MCEQIRMLIKKKFPKAKPTLSQFSKFQRAILLYELQNKKVAKIH